MATKRRSKTKPWSATFMGRPVPKGRPRLGRRGRVFTPEKTLMAEAIIHQGWDGPRYENPVKMTVHFYVDKTTVTVEPYDVTPSKLRGDIDNYLKLLMDGLNGAAWVDDKQVHYVEVHKH